MKRLWQSLFVGIVIGISCTLASCGGPGGKPLSVNVSGTLTPAGPQIAAQSPMAGERLPLAPVIEIAFDREMDRQPTSAAWTFSDAQGNPITGDITWPDARTFRFAPGTKLTPDSRYTGVFSTSAVGLDGTPISAEIRLDFRTVNAFVVGQVFPSDGTQDVDVATGITVTFNRPVVPLTVVEEQAGLVQPLEFTPPVSGQGRWVNSSMYVFQPDQALDSGSSYTVRVGGGLADVSGNTLEGDYTWWFNTRPVAGYVEGGVQENFLLDSPIAITFLQPMDQESVNQALSLVNRETGQPFPVKLEWSTDSTQLKIKPSGLFRIASFYRMSITGAALAQDGSPLQTPIVYDFSTLPLPRVVSVSPDPNVAATSFNPWLSITFSSPMKLDSLKDRVKFVPELPAHSTTYYDEYQNVLNIYGLEAGTSYIVRLLPGMADIYGNTINSEYSFSLKTADQTPYAYLLNPGTPLVYRAHGEQDIFLEYTNLDSADVSLYSISFTEFSSLVSGDVERTNFRPNSESLREWQPDVQGLPNRLIRTKLDFKSADGSPLPPGYYFLGLNATPLDYSSVFLQGLVFMVSTDNITLKTTPSESLVWLTDLETGRPTAGVPVTVYNDHLQEIGSAVTDADGLAYVDNLEKPYYARAEDGSHSAFASQDWGSGVSAGQYGMWSNYYSEYSMRFAYVYTDRPLYRPGQEVYLTGIVRRNDDLHYSLPADSTVYVTIEHFGEKVYSEQLTLSDMGSFTTTFTLSADAALGSYDVYVYDAPTSTEAFSMAYFGVAEYHKPEFQLQAAANPAETLAGETLTVGLDATYYSGGNVTGAGVSWYMETLPFYFQPSDEYTQYSFSDWDRDAYWSDPQQRAPGILAEGSGATDETGHFSLEHVATLGQNKSSRQVQFYADVTDQSGNVVGTHASFVVHAGKIYPGIQSDRYIGVQGEQQTFNLAALDWDSKPVAGQLLNVSIVERQWFSVQEQDAQGQVRWVTSVKDVPVKDFTGIVTDGDGLASVSFTPEKGGVYKALVTARDSTGHSQQSSMFLWVAGSDYIPWRQTNDRSFNLVVDKNMYSPGDTAEVLIAQPFTGETYALVTVERGHVYEREVIKLSGSSTIYHLPVTSEMAPAAYVSVVVISGAQAKGMPDFRVGMTSLNVDTSQQALHVTIQADKTAAGPGDVVTYTIQVRDADGQPVEAELSAALVDKAILALAPSNSPPILDGFYPIQSLNVVTAVGIVASADDFNANYQETPPDGEHGGGGGDGKGTGNEGVVDVRENFRDTAFFQAQVKTDASGKASLSVTLPENLTTWVMDVRAATADSLVGQATHELVSTKRMFVQLQTPRFFVASDMARIGATVFNNTNSAMDVRVSLDGQGVSLLAEQEQTVTVEAQRQAYVIWDVQVAGNAQRVDLTARAVSGSYEDSSKPPLGTLDGQGIPVYTYHVTETVGTSGLLSGADSATEAIQLPATIPLDNASISVEIAPSLAASIQDSLTYLEDYPYSCMEQTISRFLPNVAAVRILDLAGHPDTSLRANLDAQVNSALQRIYATQNFDGGWGWWNGDSDTLTSAYVVLGLAEAQEAGYAISEQVLTNSFQYLLSSLQKLADDALPWQYNRQAFIVYALARAGTPQPGPVVSLYERRDLLSRYAEAFLAQALYLQNPDDGRIATLMSDLSSAAVLSAAGAHWEEAEDDTWNWNSDLRTTAIVLNAFVQIDPQNPVAANAVRWLMAHRTTGSWASTQETTWSLMALTNWLVTSQEFQTNYSYAVGLNSQLLQEGTASADNLDQTVTLQVGIQQLLTDAINYLVITRGSGPGNLYYTAYLNADLPVSQVKALDQGIVVARQYYGLEDDKTPITEIQRGEIVRVRVTVIAPASLHYVMVNDSLPAGLEAIDASLLTDTQVPSKYSVQRFDDSGWGWWYFDHIERRDEKVVLSADYLPAGTYVYSYLARASTVGTYNVLPVTAQEFYFPDVAGRGDGSVFIVRP